jgi:hypothetical protein
MKSIGVPYYEEKEALLKTKPIEDILKPSFVVVVKGPQE